MTPKPEGLGEWTFDEIIECLSITEATEQDILRAHPESYMDEPVWVTDERWAMLEETSRVDIVRALNAAISEITGMEPPEQSR